MNEWTTTANFTSKYTVTATTAPTTTCNYKLMVTTGTGTNGWYYNSLNTYQKVNGAIYVYVEPMMFNMYRTQLYMRGNVSFCTLEARTVSDTTDPTIIFELAESWLEKYGDGDPQKLKADFYYVYSDTGAWSPTNAHLKQYYINREV